MKRGVCVISLVAVYLSVIGVNGAKNTRRVYGRPDYFPVCFRNDPNLNQCLLDATEQVKPYLAKGVPELRITPFEPFNIPEIQLQQGTNALNFKATLKNVVAHGLTNYKFTRFDFNVPKYEFFCNAEIAKVVLEGDYLISGRILIAPIEGKGKFVAEIDSCDVFVYQKYKQATLADKKIHLVPTQTNSSIEVQSPKVKLEGLFDGNEELTSATNKAINDNVDVLFEELKPVVEETISQIMENVLFKSIIEKIPWDDLYPVNPKFPV